MIWNILGWSYGGKKTKQNKKPTLQKNFEDYHSEYIVKWLHDTVEMITQSTLSLPHSKTDE